MSGGVIQPIQISITGLVTSTEYQKAKLCVQLLHQRLPHLFPQPLIRGLLEFDWQEFIMKQRREFGQKMWKIKEPVLITANNGYVGGSKNFLKEISTTCRVKLPTENADYYGPMIFDYLSTLRKTERIYVHMDVTVNNRSVGSMLFQLYSDLLPNTCENFRCLCTGEKGGNADGVLLHYKNTLIHRVVKKGWLQGGDVELRTGGGGASIYGRTFPDESYCIPHDRRGVLSMANDGRHTNSSQFFITLQPTPWMNFYYVAFGQMVEGESILRVLESVETLYERPLQKIAIVDCGELVLRESPFVVGPPEPLPEVAPPHPTSEVFGEEETSSVETATPSSGDVIDLRDTPSFLYEHRFQTGLYALSLTEKLVERVLAQSEIILYDDLTEHLLTMMNTAIDKKEEEELIDPKELAAQVVWHTLQMAVDSRPEAVAEMVMTELVSLATGGEGPPLLTRISEEVVRRVTVSQMPEPHPSTSSNLYNLAFVLVEEVVRESLDHGCLSTLVVSLLDEAVVRSWCHTFIRGMVDIIADIIAVSMNFVGGLLEEATPACQERMRKMTTLPSIPSGEELKKVSSLCVE